MNSAVYEGAVRHRRHTPARREFRYPLFMTYLDLDELPDVFAGSRLWSIERTNLVTFRRADYHGDAAVPLADAVRALVRARLGIDADGRIGMLTHLRFLGHCFNPVTFYYCHDAGGRLAALVAEVTNTPWRERHAYVQAVPPSEHEDAAFDLALPKAFHVSPFLPMDMDYRWRCSPPGARVLVHMENYRNGELQFDATLTLTDRREFPSAAAYRVPLRRPFMTAKVVAWIHWQALQLWRRRTPFFAHPPRAEETVR